MFKKENFLGILLFGSLAGVSETFIGGARIPYSSVVLSSITLIILAIARSGIPVRGSSFLIVTVALLFKINSLGMQTCCTVPAFLCGPSALILLGAGFELFASLFLSEGRQGKANYFMACFLTSLFTFIAFAVLQTYIVKSWDGSRFIQYVFIRGTMTAFVSGILSIPAVYLAGTVRNIKLPFFSRNVINGMLGVLILMIWLAGYFAA